MSQEKLFVNEIFLSLQGESTYAGLPCVFVRLTGCDLRCSYCDTAYAFSEGEQLSIDEIFGRVKELSEPFRCVESLLRLPIVEVTGGEPLLQRATPTLLDRLCNADYTVLLETSGAHDISVTPRGVRRIMDLKCPSSGESNKNRWENLKYLTREDEIKFVIATYEDYQWSRAVISEKNLAHICPILFSWCEPLSAEQSHLSLKPFPAGQRRISRRELAELIIKDGLPVRFQIQLHKIIWSDVLRGV
ncbi:MAG: radical SAM protein [Verrucomicrobiia bacterium]